MQIIYLIIILLINFEIFASLCSETSLCRCELLVNNVNFGNIITYNNSNIMMPFNLFVKCSVDAASNISYNIDYVVNFNDANNDNRTMKNSDNILQYGIYLSTNYLQSIDSFSNSLTLAPGMEETYTYTFYANISSGQQYAKVGTYSDSLLVTLNY
jgi:spore coat protein U-like protein